MSRKANVRDLGGTNRIRDLVESPAATDDIDDLAVTTAKLADSAVATAKIADDAVTNAKLANMATKTYKGRTSGGTGDPEDVAAATVRGDISAEQLGYVRGFNIQASNYTIASGDEGKVIYMNNGVSNVTLTLPTGFDNAYITIIQAGTGTVTLAAGAGAALNSYNSAYKLAGQWAAATAVQSGVSWFASGNLIP